MEQIFSRLSGDNAVGQRLAAARERLSALRAAEQPTAAERQQLLEATLEDLERAYADMDVLSGGARLDQELQEAVRRNDEARALLDTLLVTAPVGICFFDADLRFVLINDALAAINGLPADEHIGRRIYEVLPNFDPAVIKLYREVLETGEPIVDLEVSGRVLNSGGNNRHFLASYYPVKNPYGEILGVGAIVSEITERKEAEQQLRESEERFRAMADSAPVMIWMSGTDGKCNWFNQPWLRFTGRTMEQELGDGWTEGVHPEDYERCMQTYVVNFEARREFQIEYRLRNFTGEYCWVLDIGAPRYTPDGSFAGFIGSSLDISDRKRAEELLRFPAEASSVLAASLDYTTTLRNVARLVVPSLADWCEVNLLADDGTLDLVAVSHVDEAKAAWAREIRQRYPVDLDAPRGLGNVLRTGASELYADISAEMLERVARDPEHLQLLRGIGFRSVMLVPLIARGHTLGALVFVSAESRRRYDEVDLRLAEDLAHRAALAVDNARLYQEAQEAIHVRDEFLSIAAHELKTPITSLLAYTQVLQRRMLREGSAKDRDQRALNVIAEQAERLSRLIGSLLDLSRIETGHFTIEQQLVDVAGLARRVVEQMQPAHEHHRISVAAPPEPLIVRGDDLRLEQVVQNLLQNAVKYSPDGGAVELDVSREDGYALLAVTDHGIGIPAAEQAQLFQRFFRAGNVSSTHISGLGIGLYVVREIVSRHGGDVSVQSVEGYGTTFTVRLPL